jgi:SAM-dependent methyltransferase
VTELFRYEADDVDVDARDLPGLKARFLVDHVPDGTVILDIGCGGGKMLRTISKHRPRSVLLGCDVKEPRATDGGFDFRRVDPADGLLPYEDSVVDVALLFDVLEHVEHPVELLDEVDRVLRPGGLVVAFVPVEGEPFSWYSLFRLVLGNDLYVETKDHLQSFRHAEVEAMIGRHFRLEDRQYAYHVLGQLMDAGFCALLRIPSVKRMFWTESPYHNRTDHPKTFAARWFTRLLMAANAVAWAESKLLARIRFASGGLLLTARRPRTASA